MKPQNSSKFRKGRSFCLNFVWHHELFWFRQGPMARSAVKPEGTHVALNSVFVERARDDGGSNSSHFGNMDWMMVSWVFRGAKLAMPATTNNQQQTCHYRNGCSSVGLKACRSGAADPSPSEPNHGMELKGRWGCSPQVDLVRPNMIKHENFLTTNLVHGFDFPNVLYVTANCPNELVSHHPFSDSCMWLSVKCLPLLLLRWAWSYSPWEFWLCTCKGAQRLSGMHMFV